MTVLDHHPHCGWHTDQYNFECTCGATAPRPHWSDVPQDWRSGDATKKGGNSMEHDELIMLSAAAIYGGMDTAGKVSQLYEKAMREAISDARRIWEMIRKDREWQADEKEWIKKIDPNAAS